MEVTRVLLVEDDEDDFIITRDLLSHIPGKRFVLDWARNCDEGLRLMVLNQHDVCLVDYRLGAHTGIELMRMAREAGSQTPVILLTTSDQHQVDLEAMEAGASDYLVKGGLTPDWLERSIRYTIQRKRATAIAAFEQARLAAFGAEIGLALTRRDTLDGILHRCAMAMAQYLNAALAQIFTFDAGQSTLNLRANAGSLVEKNGDGKLPLMRIEPDQIAEGRPILVRQLLSDPRLLNRAEAEAAGLASYAACPLVLEDKLIGLMSIFSQHPLSEQVGQEMASVANGIALCIERKRSEEALGASERKYQSVVESIKEVIFQMDRSGNFTFLNPAWTAITGFDVAESLGTCFLDYVHEDDREHNRRVFTELMELRRESFRHETRYLTRDGTVRWVEVNVQAIVNRDGSIGGASGSLSDITDRHLAEMQIQKLAAFPRVNPNPVLEISADGALTYANDAAWEMARNLGQREVLAILPPDAPAIVRECLASGEKKLRKTLIINGRTLSWSFFPVVSSQVVHCYGGDVTDVLNLEAQLRQSQKMECVGQLAAGVAHDINNVLTVVQGRAGLLLNTAAPGSDMERSLKQISMAAERAARFIRQLLMFSRKQVIQTKALSLNNVIHNLENMLSRMLGEDIALETVCAPDVPRVEADTGMIEQVIMNLAVNARDAMPRGGKLIISTSVEDISDADAARHAGATPGRFVCMTVSDTGCGMDAKTLERIFEPFFTTKETGKGTGLGLATVYGIVRQHRGWIDVQSAVGEGTTFRIYIPAAEQSHGYATDFITKPGAVRGGNESVLVVEDEPGLRDLVQQVLRAYDYRVAIASSGTEALRVWDEHQGRFDLLLTDMIMPGGMNGQDLAQELKRRKPDLKVVISSGYSSDLIGKDLARGGSVFLPKPYLPAQLASVVRECLDGMCPDPVGQTRTTTGPDLLLSR
ncbi:MAG TPA: response regulator [Verrucomicrobiota bacterium]|nr:response regulator [Verrucomicrobiota bacterium]HPU55193.1 response regulator [Verrucomicrobiota bacterium]